VSPGLKVFPQIRMVINFAVEDDPNTAILIAQGLMPGFYVNNAEATHRESDVFLQKNPFVVGPTVNDLLVHRYK
jgi:hypothetical protein